ncbi:hypothetical protein L227DRAFT_68773 [Lentinus tigrinus ALCF2SS1-6]|uniref:DUF7729 domain-containing protein n=1 Tax=Lentinus tigrinus ALCF2SS1-6 TaxID=1328759 RepID=A0A5C2SCF2_9APHY|nr:hypothetical protein L227DRAFT_68773 [Lentinus tigrinus ALCF2SS1-6]
MFTPPPSPDPRRVQRNSSTSPAIPSGPALKLDVADDPFLSPSSSRSRSISPDSQPLQSHETPLSPKEDPYTYAQLQKKRVGRRTRWAVVFLPLALVLIALSTRYLTHPAAFDAFSTRSPSWSSVKDWTPHKRHAAPDPVPATSAATTVDNAKPTGTDLSLAPSASSVPTQVDSSNTKVPWTAPSLPTPFPQPFDSTLSTNFSTVGCQDFMTNMTQTAPFRECRPFSLLVGDSNAFITQSQRNISELNVIIWGTCNTDLSAEQCSSNMGWFANQIQTACKKDIAAQNALVLDAVAGLNSYSMMREAACQINQETDTYCYVEATQSTHPSDLYLYQLPLGLALPNTTVPSCTSCVQSVMSVFAKEGTTNAELKETYAPASTIVNNACGDQFVATLNTTTGNGAQAVGVGMRPFLAVGAALLVVQLVM